MPTTRRSTLFRLAALPGLLLLGAAGRRAPSRPARLVAVLSRPDSARRIGRLYLDAHPQEADAERLAAAIDAAVGPADGRLALRRGLRRAVRDDMVNGRSVQVDGWVLARTEARLYALACLA